MTVAGHGGGVLPLIAMMAIFACALLTNMARADHGPATWSAAAPSVVVIEPTWPGYNRPGFGAPPHPQYSGFLDASAAEPGTKLHYWFAQSSRDDYASRPVVLWLNGGPGSSSVLGWLQEMGPLLVNRTGGLMPNPWAWTLEANVLALTSFMSKRPMSAGRA